MSTRPEITTDLDGVAFRSFYYLKDELVRFCTANGLPSSGGKLALTDRIAHFLDTGTCLSVTAVSKTNATTGIIHKNSQIGSAFVCSEQCRTFFIEKIGKSFSFNVAFQKWLKANPEKTYSQAIDAYRHILAEKKSKKTTIDKQFEYNAYIRSFFEDNKGLSLKDAIRCWNYKKGLQGHHRYERADLIALEGGI